MDKETERLILEARLEEVRLIRATPHWGEHPREQELRCQLAALDGEPPEVVYHSGSHGQKWIGPLYPGNEPHYRFLIEREDRGVISDLLDAAEYFCHPTALPQPLKGINTETYLIEKVEAYRNAPHSPKLFEAE
jgi:hypothetical protein